MIKNMEKDILVGMEIHVELNTKTKLFCGCFTGSGNDLPNSLCCPTCIGMPGSKPVLNKKAIDYGIKLALALKCNLANELIFSRKTYFYPDMAKNYQITQYELPLGSKGELELENKKIRIRRVHLEEDPASLIHSGNMVLVDYNRSGHPLCEIVTEPDMKSPEEARELMKKLIAILKYLGIFDVNRCVIKADVNVNIENFERIEIKNVTGFKEIEDAISYEVERQQRLLSEGNPIKIRETRGWDSERKITFFQRSKETEEDYGYILDADLVSILLKESEVSKIKRELPELPKEKALRYFKQFKLKKDDAEVIANDYELAMIFEKAVKKIDPFFAAEWIRREIPRVLNYTKRELDETFIKKGLFDILELISSKKITRSIGQKLMELLSEKDINIKKYVIEKKLESVSDFSELEKICLKIIRENKNAVDEFKSGNKKSFNYLIGKVMAATQGRSDPKRIREILIKKIS